MQSQTSLLRIVALCLAGLASAGARADFPFHIPQYTGTPLMIATGVVTQRTLNRSLERTTPGGMTRSNTPATSPSKLLVGSKPAGMPARLASHFPASARAEAEHVYLDMLVKHPQLMKQLGVPSDDLASGVATFLAGSYMAYRDIDFPDRQFKPLYEQVRAILAANPKFGEAGLDERREMFEQMVIIGTYLALAHEALKQTPNPRVASDMKVAAKGYLEQFMKLDAERLQLTDQGLTVR